MSSIWLAVGRQPIQAALSLKRCVGWESSRALPLRRHFCAAFMAAAADFLPRRSWIALESLERSQSGCRGVSRRTSSKCLVKSLVFFPGRLQPGGYAVVIIDVGRCTVFDQPLEESRIEFLLDSFGMSVARDKIVFNQGEITGNIWLTTLPEN